MRYGTHVLVGVFVAGLLAAGASVTAQTQRDEPTVGSMVTLTSCVERAKKDKTYVLTHVADVPVHPATKGGRVVYWLDKEGADKLKPHVGHQIRLMARITDVDRGEIEVKAGNGMLVEIEGPGRDVRTPASNVGISADRVPEKNDIKTTLVKLKVDRLDMVAANCPLAAR